MEKTVERVPLPFAHCSMRSAISPHAVGWILRLFEPIIEKNQDRNPANRRGTSKKLRSVPMDQKIDILFIFGPVLINGRLIGHNHIDLTRVN